MTDRTLLLADAEPARLPGYGTHPGNHRPDTIALASGPGTSASDLNVWVRRLYTAPGTGELAAMDSTARLFPPTPETLPPNPGQHLPDPVLRCPYPAPRPRHSLARRRPHEHHQWPGPLRSLQPHQRKHRLDSPTPYPARATPHHRNHHSHRPHLPLHRTTPTRHPISPHTTGNGHTARVHAGVIARRARPGKSDAAPHAPRAQPDPATAKAKEERHSVVAPTKPPPAQFVRPRCFVGRKSSTVQARGLNRSACVKQLRPGRNPWFLPERSRHPPSDV